MNYLRPLSATGTSKRFPGFRIIAVTLVLVLTLLVGMPEPANAATIKATIPVGAEPSGVAANPSTNQIYVANMMSGTISVIDGATGTVTATITVGAWASYPCGVAVNPATNRIYVTISTLDVVSVIDGQSNTVIATVTVGDSPYGIALNPSTNRIYVANEGGDTISVIDGITNTVVATIIFPVGSMPTMIALNTSTNRIYVTNKDSNSVSVIDGNTNTIVAQITTGIGLGPLGIAANSSTNRIYVTNSGSNTVSVIDGATNTVVATLPVGLYPYGLAVNPWTNLIYVPNQNSSTISVIDGATNTLISAVATITGLPIHAAVNSQTGLVYVVDSPLNRVLVLSDSPTIAGVSPTTGTQGQILTVTINGTYFTPLTTVNFGSGITINSLTVSSNTGLTASITIAADAAPGTRDVSVTTAGGTAVLTGIFTVVLRQSMNINTATGTGTATFSINSGSINGLTAAAITACGIKPGYFFQHGFFSTNITTITPGSTVILTIILPSNMPVGTQYWKCINGVWVDCSSLLGDNDGDNVLTLTLTDGGRGDADGIANGTIVDPGGPALPVSQAGQSDKPKLFMDSSVSPTMPAQITKAGARLSVKYLNVQPQQAVINQPITIAANIANSGDEAGQYVASLKINGHLEQTKTGTISAHVAQPITFTVAKDKPGTYTVDINGQISSFTISSQTASKSTISTAGMLYIVLAVMIIAVFVMSILVIQRRQDNYS